jgi:hypothetical protein
MHRLLIVLSLAGCDGERIVALPPSPPASSSVVEKADPGPPCAAPRIVVTDPVKIECWPEQICKSTIAYAIDNCTDRPIRLNTLVVTAGKSESVTTITFDTPQIIAARARRSVAFPHDGAPRWLELGKYEIVAAITGAGDDAGGTQVLETSFVVVDAALEKAKLECLARGDDWGSVGMFGTLRCAKVMKDEGKVCSDESDCGGYCFFERAVAVSPTEKKVFGRCTRTRERFGCHAIIGKTSGGLIPIGNRFPKMCVD